MDSLNTNITSYISFEQHTRYCRENLPEVFKSFLSESEQEYIIHEVVWESRENYMLRTPGTPICLDLDLFNIRSRILTTYNDNERQSPIEDTCDNFDPFDFINEYGYSN